MKTFEQYIGEAKQNYIFGGTDDRNTKIHVNFKDLVKGDKFYAYNVCLSTKEVIRKIHTFIEFGFPSYSKTEKVMFFTQENGVKTSIGVSKEELECSLTCMHMHKDIFIIFSTFDIDDEEAINKAKELNASGKKSIFE